MADFGIAPFESHRGFYLINDGGSAIDLSITNTNQGTYSIALDPHEGFFVDSYAGTAEPSYDLAIQNLSAIDSATVGVTEYGYDFSLNLGDGITAPDTFSAMLVRNGEETNDNVRVRIEGRDSLGSTEEVFVMVHSGDLNVADAGDLPSQQGRGALRMLPAIPNPFQSLTQVRLTLPTEGRVKVTIHDATGRRVRNLVDDVLVPGFHSFPWDGRSDDGRALPAGVYFSRIETAGERAGGENVILVR
jgi:hypothetical protein